MDRGGWWATVHRVSKSWTDWSDFAHVHMQLQFYKYYSSLSYLLFLLLFIPALFTSLIFVSLVFLLFFLIIMWFYLLFSPEYHAFVFISDIISSMTSISMLNLIHLLSFLSFFLLLSDLNFEIYNSRDFSISLNTFCVYI